MGYFKEFNSFSRVDKTSARYRMDEYLRWELLFKGSGLWVVIPKDFEFDFSVPWVFRWMLNRHDRRYLPPAALHDRLLAMGADRSGAAAAFRRALIARGIPHWRAVLMSVSVWLWTTLT